MGRLLLSAIISLCASCTYFVVLLPSPNYVTHHQQGQNENAADVASSSSMHRRLLKSYGLTRFKFFKPGKRYDPLMDPRTVDVKKKTRLASAPAPASTSNSKKSQSILPPIHVCDRPSPIQHEVDMQIMQRYERCPNLNKPPEQMKLFLLEGVETFGRTGNNLIEFMHSLQYAEDNDNTIVGIIMGSWPTHLITPMWMAVQNGDLDGWKTLMERSFCVKMLEKSDDVKSYKKVIRMETRDIFMYKTEVALNQYVQYQGYILRNLYRLSNNGTGSTMRKKPVGDMCSVLDAIFGNEKSSATYSVIHSRSLEGDPGLRLLGRIARNIGIDPVAALDMEPEYVKAILGPLGMLKHPILFITDHQRPEILEKLMADKDIGPNIILVPEKASWVGADITTAVMADVFIGNPASSFSGFIAKSRLALGYKTTYLFRRKNPDGTWVDVCDERCIFDSQAMNAMA